MQVFLKPFAGIGLFSMTVTGFRHAGGSEKNRPFVLHNQRRKIYPPWHSKNNPKKKTIEIGERIFPPPNFI
jgi:hypothetical protein